MITKDCSKGFLKKRCNKVAANSLSRELELKSFMHSLTRSQSFVQTVSATIVNMKKKSTGWLLLFFFFQFKNYRLNECLL